MSGTKYDRSITLICPVCGSSEFEHDLGNDAVPVRCTGCERTVHEQTLIDENRARIDDAVDEMKGEVVSDLQRQMRAKLRGTGWKLR